MSNSGSDGSFDLVGAPDTVNDGLQYVAGRSSKKKEKRKSRRDTTGGNRSNSNSSLSNSNSQTAALNNSKTSPTSVTKSDAFDFGNAYVKPKQPEEHVSLVSSENCLDPNDPLAGNFTIEEFHDEDVDDEINEKRRNFDAFGDTEKESGLKRTLRFLQTYAIPLLICVLFLFGIVAGILYLAGFGKNDSKTVQVVLAAPESLSLMCDVSDQGGITSDMEVPELCEDNCLSAECCWNPSGPFVCSDDTKKQCPSYQVECAPWKDKMIADKKGKNSMTVPPVPAGLQTSCTRTFSEGVSADCKTGCWAADCCWNSESTLTCTPESVHNCPGYKEVCSFLNDALGDDGSQPVMEVPNVPAGLQTSCDQTSSEVSDDCKTGCWAADCCWNNGSPMSCSPESVDNYCLEYKEICFFLNDALGEDGSRPSSGSGKAPFPAAPDGLSVYCDPAEMEEISLHICQDKCSDAECCWRTGVASCIGQYAGDACHDYTQSCAILNQLATATGNSHDITSETPPAATAQSNHDTLPVAPAGLADLCSKERIDDPDTGGEALIQCEQQCLKSSCCWQPNAAIPCTTNERCPAYTEPCSIFTNLFDKPQDYNPTEETLAPFEISQVPTAPDTINDNCSPDVLKVNVDGGKFIVECEKQCLMGACCWKENHPTQCPDALECGAYERPCGTNLVNALISLEGGSTPGSTPAAPGPSPTRPAPVVETNVPEAPDDIAMMCAPDVLKLSVSDGDFIISCEKECLEAACCWKEGHATVCPDAPQCDEYLVPCGEHLAPVLEQMEPVNGNSGGGGGTAASTPAPAPTIPNAPDDMNLRCSLANVNTNPEGRGFCEESCNEAKCCWNNGGTASPECAGNPVCTEYRLCENLLTSSPSSGSTGGNTPPAPPDDLATICAAGSILDLTGLEVCKQACKAGDCCWIYDNDVESCTPAVECRTYETDCALMRNMVAESLGSSGSSGGTGGSTTSIQSACDTTTDFYLKSVCETACEPGQCCLDGSACQDGIDCLIYEPCSVLDGSNRHMLRHR